MSKNILFIDVQTIKDRTGLHDNMDEKLVTPNIKTAQDKHLLALFGTSFYTHLQAAIANATLTADEVILLNDYVADCLCYLTLNEIAVPICWQFYNKGVGRKTDTGFAGPSTTELNMLAEQMKNNAEFYKQRLIDFLRTDTVAPYKYPLYQTFATGRGIITPTNDAYSCPVWLGDDDCDCSDIPAHIRYQ